MYSYQLLVLLAVCGTICFFKASNDRRVELEETEREAQEERVRTFRVYIINAQPPQPPKLLDREPATGSAHSPGRLNRQLTVMQPTWSIATSTSVIVY